MPPFHVDVDGAFANEIIMQSRPANVEVISRARSDAVLNDLPPPPTGKPGAPTCQGIKLNASGIYWTVLDDFG